MKKNILLILLLITIFAIPLASQSYAKDLNHDNIENDLNSQGLVDPEEMQKELKGNEKEEFLELNELSKDVIVKKIGENEYAEYNGELLYFDGFEQYIDKVLIPKQEERAVSYSEEIDEERVKNYIGSLRTLIKDLDKYEITSIKESLDNFIDVKLERKDREYKGLKIDNPFDAMYITLGKDNYKLVHLINNKKFNMDEIELEVDKEKAMLAVKDFISKEYQKNVQINDIYLKVKQINNPIIEENRDLISKIYDDNLFLSYEVELSDETKINLDCYNYKIININDFKNSTSFYDRQKNMYNWENAKSIAEVMKIKGLPGGPVGVSADGTYNKNSILYNINTNQNQRGFSFSGHGSENSMLLTSKNQSGRDPHVKIYASECNSNSRWKFVFMDMCESEKGNAWASVFNIWSSSKGKVLLGWRETVYVSASHVFVTELRNQSVAHPRDALYKNVLKAKSIASAKGEDVSHLNFRGDYGY